MPTKLPLTHIHRGALETGPGRAPLLVLAHGYGSNEQDLFALADYLDPRFAVVSLRAPLTVQPGAYAWYHVNWSPDGRAHGDESLAARSLALYRDCVAAAVAAYDADPARVFLAGFSQGAMMSQALALMHPEIAAGAVLMSGRTIKLLRDAKLPSDRRYPPFFVAHGVADSVVPVSEGRATRDYLGALKADVDYREYPMSHTISEQSLADADAWLSARLGPAQSAS